jgi:hypothetical protein
MGELLEIGWFMTAAHYMLPCGPPGTGNCRRTPERVTKYWGKPVVVVVAAWR